MTNNTYHKLVNEWRFNRFNDTLFDYLTSIGEDYDEFTSNSDLMKSARTTVKKSGVWLEDSCEEELYVVCMPFGGYTDYSALKSALKEYRESGRSNKIYRKICNRFNGSNDYSNLTI